MTIIMSLLIQMLHVGLILATAPTMVGLTDWLDARLTGRSGPSILMPWRDLLRQSRKTPTVSDNTSIVSRLAPTLSLGATVSAAALVPSFSLGMALSPLADVLVIVSLLIISRVALALAVLDSGAALPGLAQQGASALAVLAEPALMLAVVTPALMAGGFNLDQIIGQQREGILLPAAASALSLTALLALVLADASAVGNAANHSFSGIDLAMSWAGAWIRRLVWINLIGALFLPIGIAVADAGAAAALIGLAAWTLKLLAFLLAMSAIRVILGRIARHSLPDLIGVAALLALLAIVMVLASTGIA